ncbi:MAG: hypothetical protein QM703_15780 [Gemmatales bacterium]
MAIDPSQEMHVRVFYSVDLVGSTKLKNELNHHRLLEEYQGRIQLVSRLRDKKQIVAGEGAITDECVLSSLGISDEDYDWQQVVSSFYSTFHNAFASEVKLIEPRIPQLLSKCEPWKAVGDELLYQFRVNNRAEIYWLTVAFILALRTIDAKVKASDTQRGLRLKGTAWVAGFPIRNRVIKLPAIETDDFLGPEIDTGFRISKTTRPGMLAVSVELGELLAETRDLDTFMGLIVGWERMKGVWNDCLYPVIWVDLPRGTLENRKAQEAIKFTNWQQQECALIRSWANTQLEQLRTYLEQLRELRVLLHPSLGIVDPYIVTEDQFSDSIPQEHDQIRDLMSRIEEFHAKASSQGNSQDDMFLPEITPDQANKLASEVLVPPEGK